MSQNNLFLKHLQMLPGISFKKQECKINGFFGIDKQGKEFRPFAYPLIVT